MCAELPTGTKTPLPHVQLAALMSDKMDVTIDSTKLRLFVLAYWNRIKPLAHAIHNKGDQ